MTRSRGKLYNNLESPLKYLEKDNSRETGRHTIAIKWLVSENENINTLHIPKA